MTRLDSINTQIRNNYLFSCKLSKTCVENLSVPKNKTFHGAEIGVDPDWICLGKVVPPESSDAGLLCSFLKHNVVCSVE